MGKGRGGSEAMRLKCREVEPFVMMNEPLGRKSDGRPAWSNFPMIDPLGHESVGERPAWS